MSNIIVIRFIRNTQNSNLDDVVRVSPVWEEVDDEMSIQAYRVRMNISKAGCGDNVSKKYEQVVSGSKLTLYLSSLLRLVVHDDEPFEHIQVDLPMAPSVVYTTQQLEKSLYNILGLVEVTLHSWPKVVSRNDELPCH